MPNERMTSIIVSKKREYQIILFPFCYGHMTALQLPNYLKIIIKTREVKDICDSSFENGGSYLMFLHSKKLAKTRAMKMG